MNPTWEQIVHFKPEEFACSCCGEQRMSLEFVLMLDDLRHRLGFPLVITSGYRCPWYNDQVSSTGFNGPHTTGRAADVAVHGREAFRLVQQGSLGGWFTGIGLKQHGEYASRFIHLDNLDSEGVRNRPRIWTYA